MTSSKGGGKTVSAGTRKRTQTKANKKANAKTASKGGGRKRAKR